MKTPTIQEAGDGESAAMARLRHVAADAGKPITRHAFINPDEAAAILAEIEGAVRLKAPNEAKAQEVPGGWMAASAALARLRQVASDAGKPVTRHTLINPDEAAVVLAEVERLRAEIARLRGPGPAEADPSNSHE